MDRKVKQLKALRERRRLRNKVRVAGSSARPRLCVTRTARHVYAQVIDDTRGVTLVSASSFERGARAPAHTAGCAEIGRRLAQRCLEKAISKVVFDKNGNLYHGRVKSIADGARAGGLNF